MKRLYAAAQLILGLTGVSRRAARPHGPKPPEVREISIFIHRLAPEFDHYRIVQFSDLHLDGVTVTRARFDALVALINAQQPDLIAFTGDFVTDDVRFRLEDLILPLCDLRARDAKVAVMGNHDHGLKVGLIQRAIREGGLVNLNNAVYSIQRENACLHIAGVDSLIRHHARLDQVLEKLPQTGAALLLAHEPTFVDMSAATERFALQLSGHTHGGQIRIPIITRLVLSGYTTRYLSGMWYIGGMGLYVNRGIGVVGLPLRINCPPEVSVITLRAAL